MFTASVSTDYACNGSEDHGYDLAARNTHWLTTYALIRKRTPRRRTKDDIISLMKKPSRLLKRKPIMTVSEFRSRFGDEVLCAEHLTAQRWPNGFVCPRCGGRSRGYMARRRVHECTGCGYQSSVTAGTIFHKTRTPLSSWFWAIYRMSQDKKGISALQLSKEIGVSYPTAWLMQHEISQGHCHLQGVNRRAGSSLIFI